MRYVLDSHTHTIASGHAYNTVFEMVQMAKEKGMELLGITEHSMAMPGTCHEFYFANIRMMPREVFGIEVMFGTEANIMDFDGTLDMPEKLLKQMDVVIASMHTPCIKPGTADENTQAYLKAMENPYVNIIGHPDDGRYPVHMEELVKGAKKHHVLLELNNSSLHPLGSRKNAREADQEMLTLCKQYEVPIILNSDAHTAFDIGNCLYSEEIVRETAFPEELIVNRSVEEYKKFINRFKKG